MRSGTFLVAIDFDGTIVDHKYPEIGQAVPGAFYWMRRWQEAGANLLLWTMRSDTLDAGDVLSQAVRFCSQAGIEFAGVNQYRQPWTHSPKLYAHVYVDDNAFGCPLVENPQPGGKPYVNWDIVGPAILERINARH
jgi:hypothetical protein